jgi:hypothetical protein
MEMVCWRLLDADDVVRGGRKGYFIVVSTSKMYTVAALDVVLVVLLSHNLISIHDAGSISSVLHRVFDNTTCSTWRTFSSDEPVTRRPQSYMNGVYASKTRIDWSMSMRVQTMPLLWRHAKMNRLHH